ncbi:MAG: cellulase family glycosylhydrolase [Limisphaerales bacterium]
MHWIAPSEKNIAAVRVLLGVLLLTSAILPAAGASGLSTDDRGEPLLRGVPFHGIGVNYYDAFTRTLGETTRTNYDAGFRELAVRRIPFARFSAGGYWPREWALYRTNRSEYFARLDGVVKSAEQHGIGLIPSFFWQVSAVPDLVGEPCNRWGDPHSRTIGFMREYTRELVTRYSRSPAIWGWEFGNEYNLAADLPNASEHRPPVAPGLGTPAHRTADDDLTHAAIRVALREFALEVRKHDPQRIIVSGNAFPRVSAWHQAQEKSWKHDTREQFAEMLAADNPSPINTLSVRGYDLTTDIERLAQAMTVARAVKKPLFVGEFGVPGAVTGESKVKFTAILSAIETNRVPLSALWVFDFDGQAQDWNVNATNDRSWQLDAIQRANERMKTSR